MIKPRFMLPIMVIGCLMTFSAAKGAGPPKPPAAGQRLPALSLQTPEDPVARQYLELGASGTFSPGQIKAPVLILQIFSMYCPYCQKEAPRLNRLYETIQSNPKLTQQIKIIGIGAGNSDFEVSFFKDSFKVPFPLFADEKFAIHQLLGQVRTPYYFVLRTDGTPTPEIIFTQSGAFKSIDSFLDAIDRHIGSANAQ